jgi:predicted Zn-ribbon and HTH transcriptional regulator
MGSKINFNRGTQLQARNRCCQCGFEWQDLPFGLAKYRACPKCDSTYWEWLNFDDDD